MSDDKKTEKKISKRREDILFWLKAAEKYANQYQQAADEKKKTKCGKSLQSAKESIQFAVNAVINLGGSIDDIPKTLSKEQFEIWNEMFGNADSEDIAIEKEIQRIKTMLNEDLKEAMEKYTYDPEAPIETRYKNKLFKAETAVGRWMLNAGDESLKDSMYYRECWNYDRDYEKTKDQYFTKEEQGLIEKCIQSRLEERDFLRQKNAFMYNLGLSIQKTAVRIGEWGDITLARIFADNLSREVFINPVKEIEGEKLSKDELNQKSKEMTRRYIQFIADENAVEEGLKVMKECEEQAGCQLEELEHGVQSAEDLSLPGLRELKKTVRMAEDEVGGVNMMTCLLLRERLGIEKAGFVLLYTYDKLKEDRKELLTSYTFEELGL